MLISICYMCLMLCAPLDWQYAELASSASDEVLCSVLVRKMWDIYPNRKEKKKKKKKVVYYLYVLLFYCTNCSYGNNHPVCKKSQFVYNHSTLATSFPF